MREMFYTIMMCVGSVMSYFIGGVDTMFIVLCIFLLVDYISGVIVAAVFKNSSKTETGKLNSSVSFKGLCKKFFVLVIIGVANLLDIALGTNFIRGGVILTFISNETISIIENAGLMGIPIPMALRKGIDILQEREEESCEHYVERH